jgi:UDP-N-acetylglucosamine--N-acetylmuramyl-(pentapeptide) pyrophosphoryl-undecaprenol N-acetylglucosamine transferase
MRVIIAGGGTGGHIFPGIAVAMEVLKRYPGSDILFITGGRQIENELLQNTGIKRVAITVEGIKGRGLAKTIKATLKLPYGFFQSLSIIKRFSPDIVLGVGGYTAGPVCLAAKLLRIKTVIHEQNSYPGVTNRLLSRFVDRVFLSFKGSKIYFSGDKIFITGNPIRSEFLTGEEGLKRDSRRFAILVTGGSQGASAINDAFIAALKRIKEMGLDPLITHQTGQADFENVVRQYKDKGLEGDIKPFIKDIAGAYRQADIVIGRAGAGTVFELAALGKPSILIPFPYAADDHQTTNARMLADAGGAMMINQRDLDPERLADVLIGFMKDKSSLEGMSKQARKAAMPDAAKLIVDKMEEMVGMKIGAGRKAQGTGKRT